MDKIKVRFTYTVISLTWASKALKKEKYIFFKNCLANILEGWYKLFKVLKEAQKLHNLLKHVAPSVRDMKFSKMPPKDGEKENSVVLPKSQDLKNHNNGAPILRKEDSMEKDVSNRTQLPLEDICLLGTPLPWREHASLQR